MRAGPGGRRDLDELRTRADVGDENVARELANLLARRGDLEELRALSRGGSSVVFRTPGGAGGSARFTIQRSRRKARSISSGVPNKAMPITVSAAATTRIANPAPRKGWATTPKAVGTPADITLAPVGRQGTRAAFAGLAVSVESGRPLPPSGARAVI